MTAIFIGGCDRSGTTMLGSMLGAHPRYLCTPESYFKFELWHDPDLARSLETFRNSAVPSRYLVDWGVNLREADAEGATGFDGIVRHVLRCYAARVGREDFETWIDHTPANLSYADQLLDRFPDARIVHLVRDGRAVAASLLAVDWGPGTILDAARFWCRKVASGLAAELVWGPDRVVRLRYEDLILDPETSLRRLCESLHLEFDPAMTGGSGFRQVSQWKDVHELVGGPPAADRVHAWKNKLSARQIEIFEWEARDLLVYLGYEPQYGLSARGPSRGERFWPWLRALAARPGQRRSRAGRARRAAAENRKKIG